MAPIHSLFFRIFGASCRGANHLQDLVHRNDLPSTLGDPLEVEAQAPVQAPVQALALALALAQALAQAPVQAH